MQDFFIFFWCRIKYSSKAYHCISLRSTKLLKHNFQRLYMQIVKFQYSKLLLNLCLVCILANFAYVQSSLLLKLYRKKQSMRMNWKSTLCSTIHITFGNYKLGSTLIKNEYSKSSMDLNMREQPVVECTTFFFFLLFTI